MTIKRGADKAKIKSLVKKLTTERQGKGIDAYKYCGTIQLEESPKEIQKRLRSEWD